MLDFLESESSSPGSRSNDPVMAAIKGELDDGGRSPLAFSAESSEVEDIILPMSEPDPLELDKSIGEDEFVRQARRKGIDPLLGSSEVREGEVNVLNEKSDGEVVGEKDPLISGGEELKEKGLQEESPIQTRGGKYVYLSYPYSSSTLEPGKSYNIRWSDNFSDNVRLELYKGSSFKQTISSSTSSDGSYYWTVPTSLSSGSDYKLKIRNASDSRVYDFSDTFKIQPSKKVDLTYPYSSSILEPGKSYNIRWTDNFSDNVKLELYKGSSLKQTISSSTYSDGSYYWTVPTSLSSGSDYKLKIRNASDSSVYDYSSSFSIKSKWPPTNYKYLGTYTGRQEYSDYVGSDDYYKFYVDSPGYLQFALRGLSSDANVQLLNSSGQVLTTSSKSGTSDEYGTYNLGTGTHYMRVYGNGGSTNYRLALNLDQAKDYMSGARWLGDLTGLRKEYKDFVGTSSGDGADYYKFTINSPRNLEYAIRDLTANADVDILDSSGYRISPKEVKDYSRYSQHETMGLKAGTYYAKVKAPTSSSQQTNYRLVLNLEGGFDPDKPDIDIQLYYPNGGFTTSQKSLIEKAAQNWEQIITRDKDDSGVLGIEVTHGSKMKNGSGWNGWWAHSWLDNAPNYRQDMTTGPGDNVVHFNSDKLGYWTSSEIVRLTMHEIGHALGMDEAQKDSSLGSDSIMDQIGLDGNITEGVYRKLEQLGYEVNRSAYIDWS